MPSMHIHKSPSLHLERISCHIARCRHTFLLHVRKDSVPQLFVVGASAYRVVAWSSGQKECRIRGRRHVTPETHDPWLACAEPTCNEMSCSVLNLVSTALTTPKGRAARWLHLPRVPIPSSTNDASISAATAMFVLRGGRSGHAV